jgi:hypothetical protein
MKMQNIAAHFYLVLTKLTLDWLTLLGCRYLWCSKCMRFLHAKTGCVNPPLMSKTKIKLKRFLTTMSIFHDFLSTH